MSEKTSRIILIIEAVLIVLPISVLALIKSGISIMFMFQFFGLFYVVAEGILALISLAAIVSGWRLFIAFLHGGAANLQKQHLGWWLALLAGVLLIIGSLISHLLPPSPEYSNMDSFRFELEFFIAASPLLIPLIHLALEKVVRKPTDEITK